ncbi:hypothetical protein V7798_16575 [Rhizobium laguerreae]
MVFQELDNYSSSEAVEAIAHLKSLIETRTFKKEQLQEDRVIADLRRLAWAASRGSVQIRLEALSVLGKAAEVSVPIAAAVRPLIISALSESPPHTGEWGNADDRYYFAKAVSASTNEWIGRYAARELALAGTSEVRSKVWAELALANCGSIAEAIEEIADGLKSQQGEGPDDPLTPFRRLNRVCRISLKAPPCFRTAGGVGFGSGASLSFQLVGGKFNRRVCKGSRNGCVVSHGSRDHDSAPSG